MSLLRKTGEEPRSLQNQLFRYVFVSLTVVVLSMSYIFFTSIRLQNIVNEQFASERYFQGLQEEILMMEEPFRNYLSTRSSTSLASLLIHQQNLRMMMPEEFPPSSDEMELKKREVYFLIDSYLELSEEAVEQKRGRAISEYTQLYERLDSLKSYILEQIDQISLSGFRVQLEEYEHIIAISRQMQFWNLLVMVFACFLAVSWMMTSMNRITTPMHQLSEMAGALADGNFDVEDIHIDTVAELSRTVEAFNQMKYEIRKSISGLQKQQEIEQDYLNEKVRNLKMEQLLKRMELYTMQAQMNPHFLFNTLNTGVQLAILEDADNTAEYMENLALFFRHNMRERKLFVPLKHELEGLRSYFYILRIRFPRTLEISMDLQEGVEECLTIDGTGPSTIPAMILQPIVENSVVHAFKGITRRGLISVRVREEDHCIILSVADNGIGMGEQQVSELLQHAERTSQLGSKVMGLENIIQRLYFFYPGNERIIEIDSRPGEGTEVRITIDKREEPCITL